MHAIGTKCGQKGFKIIATLFFSSYKNNNIEFKCDLNLILIRYLKIYVLKIWELLNINTLNMHKHEHFPPKHY